MKLLSLVCLYRNRMKSIQWELTSGSFISKKRSIECTVYMNDFFFTITFISFISIHCLGHLRYFYNTTFFWNQIESITSCTQFWNIRWKNIEGFINFVSSIITERIDTWYCWIISLIAFNASLRSDNPRSLNFWMIYYSNHHFIQSTFLSITF